MFHFLRKKYQKVFGVSFLVMILRTEVEKDVDKPGKSVDKHIFVFEVFMVMFLYVFGLPE